MYIKSYTECMHLHGQGVCVRLMLRSVWLVSGALSVVSRGSPLDLGGHRGCNGNQISPTIVS
jgi:hypothetical protein